MTFTIKCWRHKLYLLYFSGIVILRYGCVKGKINLRAALPTNRLVSRSCQNKRIAQLLRSAYGAISVHSHLPTEWNCSICQ